MTNTEEKLGIFILSGTGVTDLVVEKALMSICGRELVNYTPTFSCTFAAVLQPDEVLQLGQFPIKATPFKPSEDDENGLVYAALKANAQKNGRKPPPLDTLGG